MKDSTSLDTGRQYVKLMGDGLAMLQLANVSAHIPVYLEQNIHFIAIDCGKLKDPNGGKVSYYPDTTVYSVATYVCHAGSLLVGSPTRKCQRNGEWAGEEPTCKSKKALKTENVMIFLYKFRNPMSQATGTTSWQNIRLWLLSW